MDDPSEKKMRGSMPPKFEVWHILRTLEQARLENMLPVWVDGRMIVEEGHIALKDEMKFATRKNRAPYGLEQLEMKQEEKELNAAGPLYVALTEYKKQDPATPSTLSVGTPGDAVPWRIGLETHLRESELNQKKGRVWMRLSVKQEKKCRWGIRLSRTQLRGISPYRNYCRTEWRRLGEHSHTTPDITPSQRPGIALDERDFEHGDEALEF